MSDTPRVDAATKAAIEHGTGDVWFVAMKLERELNAANDRIMRLEEALELVLKMRNDWLENQEYGYEEAYCALVKGNDSEWEEIIKAKEDRL